MTESQILALAAQAHNFWARESHSKDLVPNLLKHATSVALSHSTLLRIDFDYFANDLSPNKTSFNSSTFIWSSFSDVEKSPTVDLDSIAALQP